MLNTENCGWCSARLNDLAEYPGPNGERWYSPGPGFSCYAWHGHHEPAPITEHPSMAGIRESLKHARRHAAGCSVAAFMCDLTEQTPYSCDCGLEPAQIALF